MIGSADILAASILIVDDQPANVALLEQMLAAAGYSAVSSTTDPTHVCELHRQHRYALILLDLQMPRMDGFQVLEGLRAIEERDYLPVLVVTAQPGHKLRALQGGAKDFVSKPFDLAEVLMRVRNMLEVRLLHVQLHDKTVRLEATLQEVEASRDVIRRQGEEVRGLYDQVLVEQKLSERLHLGALPDSIAVCPDPEIVALVPAYLERRREDVAALAGALERADFGAIRQCGHTITETGRGYGFDGITEIGSAIERAAHRGDAAAVTAAITNLSGYLQRVRVMNPTDSGAVKITL